jgi:hypothetical protein
MLTSHIKWLPSTNKCLRFLQRCSSLYTILTSHFTRSLQARLRNFQLKKIVKIIQKIRFFLFKIVNFDVLLHVYEINEKHSIKDSDFAACVRARVCVCVRWYLRYKCWVYTCVRAVCVCVSMCLCLCVCVCVCVVHGVGNSYS